MLAPGEEKFLGKTDGVPFFINHQPGWQLDEIGKAETLIWSPSSAPFLPIFFVSTPYSVFISSTFTHLSPTSFHFFVSSHTLTFSLPVFTFNYITPPQALERLMSLPQRPITCITWQNGHLFNCSVHKTSFKTIKSPNLLSQVRQSVQLLLHQTLTIYILARLRPCLITRLITKMLRAPTFTRRGFGETPETELIHHPEIITLEETQETARPKCS